MHTPAKMIATAAASLALMLTAAPASAAVMFAHFSGLVGAGSVGNATYDTGNFFGLGAGIVGSGFTATFKYDTALGAAITNTSEDTRYGGPGWACAPACMSPILEASLTINGITDNFDVTRNGSANVTINQTGWKQTFFYTDFFSGSNGNALQLFVLNVPDPLLLTTPYTGGNTMGLGVPTTNAFALGVLAGTNKDYRLALDPRSVTLVAAVPEPATWGLMIIGFACTGTMLRRRRQVLARARR